MVPKFGEPATFISRDAFNVTSRVEGHASVWIEYQEFLFILVRAFANRVEDRALASEFSYLRCTIRPRLDILSACVRCN